MQPTLWIIVPCYNEEKVIPISSSLFLDKLLDLIGKDSISENSRVLFVNDGSKDATWEIIKKLSEEDEHFIGISQSRNRGHQNAVLAGMMEARGKADVVISVDCDGQDDISVIDEMISQYKNGCEIVYGVRSNRNIDSWFKKNTAEFFYKFMNLMGCEIIYNHADFRLVSARVLRELEKFTEVNLFLRGIFPLVGFKTTSVYYERHERIAGESHYPFVKMLELAIDGITSLSIKPITLITQVGIIVSIFGFVLMIWAIIRNIQGFTVAGWTSLTCIVCFLGGIQLISLGIIGEYVGKTYMETKHRPRYIISEKTWCDNSTSKDKISGKYVR